MSLLFFFFKPKTAYEMRISDWSSDVCSSDLRHHQAIFGLRRHAQMHRTVARDDVRLVIIACIDHREARHGLADRGDQQRQHGEFWLRSTMGVEVRAQRLERSEERGGGKGGVSTCRSRWSRCD